MTLDIAPHDLGAGRKSNVSYTLYIAYYGNTNVVYSVNDEFFDHFRVYVQSPRIIRIIRNKRMRRNSFFKKEADGNH
jgi:hypothetical protein